MCWSSNSIRIFDPLVRVQRNEAFCVKPYLSDELRKRNADDVHRAVHCHCHSLPLSLCREKFELLKSQKSVVVKLLIVLVESSEKEICTQVANLGYSG